MVYQSNVRLAAGEKTKVEQIKEGVYVIANAYEGPYEYFARPKPAEPNPTEGSAERSEVTLP